VLSVLPFTASDYQFGIFKFLTQIQNRYPVLRQKTWNEYRFMV